MEEECLWDVEDEVGMRPGKATNLIIFKAQISAWSSERPTHVRSGLRTVTWEALGEWDLDLATGTSSSEDSEGSFPDVPRSMLVKEESVPLLDRVAARVGATSGDRSKSEEASSGDTGETSGETGDIRGVEPEEYRSKPAAASRLTTP